MINTIVNHNNKIKNIENNFANCSHVREVFEKTKNLRNHVFGPPRPHNWWRELVLTVIVISGAIRTMITLGNKYLVPRAIKCIQRNLDVNTERVPTISENLPQVQHVKYVEVRSVDEIKIMLEHLFQEQNKTWNEIRRTVNETQGRAINPVRADDHRSSFPQIVFKDDNKNREQEKERQRKTKRRVNRVDETRLFSLLLFLCFLLLSLLFICPLFFFQSMDHSHARVLWKAARITVLQPFFYSILVFISLHLLS